MSSMSGPRRKYLVAQLLASAVVPAVLIVAIFTHFRLVRPRRDQKRLPNISALIEAKLRRTLAAWSSPQSWSAAAAMMRRCAEKGLRRWWADPQTHIVGGNRALARGQGEVAAACFGRALDRQGGNLEAMKGSALALSLCGRHAEAVKAYEAILAKDPNDLTTRFNLAVALGRLRRFSRAERAYLQILEADPANHRARYNLAALYQAQGKLTLAARTYRDLITREPTFASAHAGLGETLLAAGQPEKAMESLGRAVKLGAAETKTWLNLASAAQAAGQLGRALFAARRAAEQDQADPAVWRRLGQLSLELHRRTGREDLLAEAIDAWRRSLQLDPSQERLGDLLETYRLAGSESD